MKLADKLYERAIRRRARTCETCVFAIKFPSFNKKKVSCMRSGKVRNINECCINYLKVEE